MDIEQLQEKFTRYEIARILGARSLQLAMDAPVLLKLSKEEMDELNFDSLKIAERESGCAYEIHKNLSRSFKV